MFYDPTCKPETKADPLSLESLIAWLEKQNPDAGYCYANGYDCLIGQWLRSNFKSVSWHVGGIFDYRVDGQIVDMLRFNRIAGGHETDNDDRHTFGAALSRARKMVA